MSNLSDPKKTNNSEQKSSDIVTTKAKRWSFIQSDLSEALKEWQELEKAEITLSPEEEQLVKIKSIIAQLTDKLNQF